MRTIQCACGWTTRSQLREANSRYRLHTKCCTYESMELTPFDADSNGFGGITTTRYGNKIQKPLQITKAIAQEDVKE